jgi:hypothetical protein
MDNFFVGALSIGLGILLYRKIAKSIIKRQRQIAELQLSPYELSVTDYAVDQTMDILATHFKKA